MVEEFMIGDLYPVWWNTESDPPNMARIIEIRPYRGPYTDMMTHILKLSAPTTKRGWLEMTVHVNNPMQPQATKLGREMNPMRKIA